LWLLFLYAADLAEWGERFDGLFEEDDADLPTLVARLLAHSVEHRLRRNLSRGYRQRTQVLRRVRGRILLAETLTRQLLSRGSVACRFDDLTFNTPRNRLVRGALELIARRIQPGEVSRRCRSLAFGLDRIGVARGLPSRADLAADVLGRNELEDRLMVALAKYALELALPTEQAGSTPAYTAVRDAIAVRHLFERAVGGFYAVALSPTTGWHVARGARLSWNVEESTPGLSALLPGMQADIVLSNRPLRRRLVIDTKFTDILVPDRWGTPKFRSAYMFQIYAYLRSQAGRGDPLDDSAEGLLLHPVIGVPIDEAMTVQGHRIRFATVDLSRPPADFRARLLELVG
jgi:5-methylcytosine-specific restriction enzyme subunit McrC